MNKKLLLIENNTYTVKKLTGQIVKSYENFDFVSIKDIKRNKRLLLIDYDIAIINLAGGDETAIKLISIIKQNAPRCKIFLLKNKATNSQLINYYELGVNLVLVLPYSQLIYTNALTMLLDKTIGKKIKDDIAKIKKLQLDARINNFLSQFKINQNTSGYVVVVEALKQILKDGNYTNNVSKKLYPKLAKQFNTTTTKIEHQIRSFIEEIWEKDKLVNINNFYDTEIFQKYIKPSNYEFLALMAERL